MTGAVYDRTKNMGLGLLEFNFPNWGDDANQNTKIIDAGFSVFGLTIKGAWANSTAYNAGDLIVDTDLGTLWRAAVNHISASSGTFAADRAAHPTYWVDASNALHARGLYVTATTYYTNDVTYMDVGKTTWAIAARQFVSTTWNADVTAGNLVVIVDMTAFVVKVGDTMTGHLGLPLGPAASQAVRRDYVDSGLAGKSNTGHGHAESEITNLVTDLAAKAPLASPVFTGNPTAPTATVGDNDTSIATTAFVTAALVATTAGDHIASVPADTYLGFKASPNRMVLNDAFGGAGTDVFLMDDKGRLSITYSGGVGAPPANTRAGVTMSGDIDFLGGYIVGWNTYLDTVSSTWKTNTTGWAGFITLDPTSGSFSIDQSQGSVAAGGNITWTNVVNFNQTTGVDFSDYLFKFGNSSNGISLQYRSTLVDCWKVAGANSFRWLKSSDGTTAGSGATVLKTLDDAGNLTVPGQLTAGTNVVGAGNFISTSGNVIIGPTGAGVCYMRPNGVGSSAGQFYVDNTGQAYMAGSAVISAANLPAYLGSYGTGGLGTYGMFRNDTGSVIVPGGLVAGSGLQYTSASGLLSGGPPTGSWRCMGYANITANPYERTATFLRYA